MVNPQKRSSEILVFDRDLIKHNRERCAKKFKEFDFIFSHTKQILKDRIYDINREFKAGLQIGSRCPVNAAEHHKIDTLVTCDLTNKPISAETTHYFQATEEFLPVKPKSLDLVISNLNLHSVNDLPGALLQIKQSLKDDGLFIASMLGGETLHELRNVMTEVELKLYGGISPRIFPFADKQQMGDLLQRAGFALPVVDSEIITVTYDNIFKLFSDLRGMGENNAIIERDKTFSSRAFFMDVAKTYQEQFAEDDGRIAVTFEIIFLLGWAPHKSQQKPLRPGSAEHRLADALSTTEIKTGEKAKP